MLDKQKHNNSRQLQIEDYLQKNELETRANAEVLSVFALFTGKETETKTVVLLKWSIRACEYCCAGF